MERAEVRAAEEVAKGTGLEGFETQGILCIGKGRGMTVYCNGT